MIEIKREDVPEYIDSVNEVEVLNPATGKPMDKAE